MSFSVNCWLPGAEIWITILCKRRFWIMSWKVVAESCLWRQLEVVRLLVVGEVMSVYSSMPLFHELWSAEGQAVSSLCTISIECVWEREVSELPMCCFLQGLSMSLGTLKARDHKDSAGLWACSLEYEGRWFGFVFFLKRLISKDLQTGQSNVSHHITVGVMWEGARLLKVSPTSSWVLLPPQAAATVPWNPLSQAAWGSLNGMVFGIPLKLQQTISEIYKYHLFLFASSCYITVARCTVKGGAFASVVKLRSVVMWAALSVLEAVRRYGCRDLTVRWFE